MMKLVRRIKINTVFYISIILVVSAVILLFSFLICKAENDRNLVEKAVMDIRNLRTVTFEYIIYHEAEGRPEKQWPVIADSLSARLKEIKPASPDEKEIAGRMLEGATGTREIYSSLLSMHKEFGGSHEKLAAAEADMSAQLLARLDNVRTDSSLLIRTIAKRQEATLIKAFGLVMFFIISMLGLVGYNEFAMKKAVGLPIGKLLSAMDVVAKGNLEHKTGISSDDEIGELAAGLDRMTMELKDVTTSRDELNIEIGERKKAEEKYRKLVENPLVGVYMSNVQGEILYMNEAALKLYEYGSLEEMRAVGAKGVYKDKSRRAVLLQELKSKGRVDNFEIEVVTKTGKVKTVLFNSALEGEVLSGMVMDITEKKKLDELLKASEERYRRLFETTKDGLLLLDYTTEQIFRSNPAARELLGYTHEELAGKKLSDIGIFMSEDELQKAFHKLHDVGYVLYDSRQIETKERGTIIADIMLVDRSDIMQCNIRDFTERRKAEEFIKDILQNVDEGFVVIDAEYKIISANRAYLEQQKAGIEDVLGRHCYEVSHHIGTPCFMAGEECAPLHTFKTGESYTAVHTHYDKKGNPVYVETKSFPMKDLSGKVFAVIETLNNITEKRRLEEQLRHAQKMESIGTLAGGIAHDFNNMLNVIIGYGALMQMRMTPDDPQMPQLKEILAAGDRAAQLTKGLLTFSRKQVMEIKTVNLNEIVEGFKKMLTRIIGEDIDLKITLSEKDLTAKADIVQIEQVLMNLAANARDAMPQGGALAIETQPVRIDREFIKTHGYGEPCMYALITVSDTGIGMDEKTRDRIFEPYFTTKEMGRGTGLGLAIIYGIVTQHNGYIHCYSEQGKGTTFRIYIPLIKAATEKLEKEEAPAPKSGKETILLAEDDPTVRGFMKQVLESFGYTVIEAVDGNDAVNKFRDNKDKIQLFLSDLIMPGKNGKDAYEDIKGMRHDLRAVFISGYARDIIQRFGIEEGVEFISKPVLPTELLRKIREALDK